MRQKEDLRLARGSKTKETILAAALELLSEEGIQGFSAGKLANKAKVSKSNLFHHFKSIDEVPLAILENVIEQLGIYMAEKKYRTVYDYVFRLGQHLIEASQKEKKRFVAFFQFYQMALVDEKYRLGEEKAIHLIAQKFQTQIERIKGKSLTKRQKETIPFLIAMGMDGMGLHCFILRDRARLLKMWKTFSQLIAGCL